MFSYRKRIELENEIAKRTAEETKEMNDLLFEMIQHGEDLPKAFLDHDLPAMRDAYLKATKRWEEEETPATEEEEPIVNTIEKEETPRVDEQKETKTQSTYFVGMAWNCGFNYTSIAQPIAVSDSVEAMESYLKTTRSLRPDQRCMMRIGKREYDTFEASGYGLVKFQNVWLTEKDLEAFSKEEAARNEWWKNVQKTLGELEERIGSFPIDALPYGKDCIPMLEALIDQIPQWAMQTPMGDGILEFFRD